MNNFLLLMLMFISGVFLAAFYLGGLWLTVQRIHNGQHPVLWLITSLLVRMLLLVVTFYLILGDDHWQRLLMALAGFVTLRIFVLHRVRHQTSLTDAKKEEPA